MELTLQIIHGELKRNGYYCEVNVKTPHLLRAAAFLSPEINPDPEILYVVGSVDAVCRLPENCSAIFCCPANRMPEELCCGFVCLKANILPQQLMNEVLSIFSQCNRYEQELLKAIVNDSGLDRCMDILSEVFGNSPYMIDSSYRLLAFPHQPELADQSYTMHHLVKRGYMPIKTVISLMENQEWQQDLQEGKTTLLHTPPFWNPFISCKIKSDGKLQGQLFIVAMKRNLEPGDLDLAEQFLPYIRTYMLRKIGIAAVQGKYYEHFFRDMILGSKQNEQWIQEQLAPMNWDIADKYAVLYCPLKDKLTSMVRMLLDSFSQLHNAKPLIIDGTMYCVFGINSPSQYSIIVRESQSCLKQYMLQGGMSMAFSGFQRLHDYAIQAKTAFELGSHQDPEIILYVYNNYIIPHLLQLYSKSAPVKCLFHLGIENLETFDKQHKTQYAQTLYVYLRNERSLLKAAAELNIHRNTLLNRLEKIREIANLNLEDPDLRLNLILSYELKKQKDFTTSKEEKL